MTKPDPIFWGRWISEALRGREQELDGFAATIPADHALTRSPDELVAELVERFRIEPLVLDWEAMTVSSKDIQIDVSGDWNRAGFGRGNPLYIDGTELTFHVPFAGERDLFKFRPSTYTANPPYGIVGDHELRLQAAAPADSRDTIKPALDAEVAKVRLYLGNANADVAKFNAGLDATARVAATRRREKVIADRELVASLGVPVRRREAAAPTYAAAPVRRQAARSSPGHPAQAPEPVIPAEEYEHILTIARGMAQLMERSPKTFARLEEEALRDHFLMQLNGQYHGGATGETFNFEGKTDILVRDKGRNLFIAECKFWDGPAKLTETVDQLLGYLSWRDTKSAIFIFNRGRALTGVLAKISPTISAHGNFVREIQYGGETDFRFVLHHRDDPERELTLTVLVFEVPGK